MLKKLLAKMVFLVVLVGAICAAFIFVPFLSKACCSAEYKAFVSPDGKWAVKVYRINNIPRMMPGSSSDAPGYIRLVNQQGKVFAEEDVAMVQLVDQIDWSKTQVTIKFVAEWPLPEQSTDAANNKK